MNECDHKWTPLSFVFETQLLDANGRVRIRQPDLHNARVYCVCMKCHSYTYTENNWVGYYKMPEEKEGNEMDIKKAIESGSRIKRSETPFWIDPKQAYHYTPEDILATDWEIEERKIEITESDFDGLIDEVHQMWTIPTNVWKELKKRLFQR